jgi:hypothetical protein
MFGMFYLAEFFKTVHVSLQAIILEFVAGEQTDSD